MQALTVESRVRDVMRRIEAACRCAGRSPDDVTVIAVAKGFPAAAIREAYAAGLRHFGENRVQEAAAKRPLLSDLDATWHMVGHLQTNKVARALELFDVVHSVDSLRLAQELSRRSRRRLPVLIEVNVAGEATKYGFPPEEVPAAADAIARLPGLEVIGLMTVAPLADDPEEVRPVFRRLRELAQSLGLPHLSMGMSDDFEVAIAEGATMVRLGRAIFGPRPQG